MSGVRGRPAAGGPLRCAAALLALGLAGCAGAIPPGGAPGSLVTSDFAAVAVRPGDSLASLARVWLRDPGRDWEIAEFNGVTEAVPGRELAIPLRPFRRGGLTAQRYQTVPVLSYHGFGERSTDASTVSREAFEAQMLYLKERGFRPVTLDRLLEFVEFRGQLPEKAVVITIDDGSRAAYEIAFPVLKRHGFPAALFVYTALLDAGPRSLSWEQLREMAAAGIEVQCHGATQRDLARQRDGESLEQYLAALQQEIAEAALVVERGLGSRPRYFAYHSGSTNGLVVALLRKHGYRGAFTLAAEPNPFFVSPYRLGRSKVAGDHDLGRFERLLTVSDRRALR